MPSQNKRVNLTLPPALYETVQRYSALLEKPEATAIREILIEMQPMMESVIRTFEKTEVTREEVLADLHETYVNTLAKGTSKVAHEMDLFRKNQ